MSAPQSGQISAVGLTSFGGCIFCIWQGGPLLLFAELHAHPIASPWERNVAPSAQFGQARPIIQTPWRVF
jgi:hypothetical protein